MIDKLNNSQKFFTPGDRTDSPHLASKKRVYFSFELQNISEIWVGPRLNFEHAKFNILQLLDSLRLKGLNIGEIQIYQSGIPYKSSLLI